HQAAHRNRHRQLRKREPQEVAIPVDRSGCNARPTKKEGVLRPARRSDWQPPDIAPIHVYAVQARRRRSRAFYSLETRDPAYHSTAGILKREGLRDACAVGLQRIASSRLVSTHRSLRIGPHGAVEKIEGRLRPFEMPAHYKR